MNKSQLASIIVPYYNTPFDYWKQCLDSLRHQTYTNIEIIVVDDGSKPEYSKALDDTSALDSRLHIYHKPNEGVSSARNYAIEHCTGELLCFVDSDDWVEPDFVETLVNGLRQSDKHIAAVNWIAETGEEKQPILNSVVPEILSKDEAYRALICSTEIQGFLCNKIFEKNLVPHGLDETLCYCEDFVFCSHYLTVTDGMSFINRQLYHYRQTGGNATSDFSFNPRIFTLLFAYKQAESVYQEQAPLYAHLVRCNVLKIALNLRARMYYNKVNDPECMQIISSTIHDYSNVLSSHISISEKLNILLTWAFPVLLFKIKSFLLGRKI